MEYIDRELAKALLPERDPMGHKGTFGRVFVLGGCMDYTGAPVFAAEAAARMGSGLVFLETPREVWPVVAARCRSAIAAPLPENLSALLAKAKMLGADAALIGPGLGREERLRELAMELAEWLSVPLVLDADGINAAAEHMDIVRRRRGPTVLTPHQGEFVRLGGSLAAGREAGALALAAETGAVVVLKGPGTVVASPEGACRVNTTGGSALAKGGTGDILAGMVVSLLGQKLPAFDAACLAVYLHGLAGDLAARDLTDYCVTPEDLLFYLPMAIKAVLL